MVKRPYYKLIRKIGINTPMLVSANTTIVEHDQITYTVKHNDNLSKIAEKIMEHSQDVMQYLRQIV